MIKFVIENKYLDEFGFSSQKPMILKDLIPSNLLLHEDQAIEIKRKNNTITIYLKDYRKEGNNGKSTQKN